jgi:hypothetical protein
MRGVVGKRLPRIFLLKVQVISAVIVIGRFLPFSREFEGFSCNPDTSAVLIVRILSPWVDGLITLLFGT